MNKYMKNKKLNWIDIIFWSIVVINCIIEINKGIINQSLPLNLDSINFYMELEIKEWIYLGSYSIIMFLLIMVIFMIISLLKTFYLSVIYIGFKLACRHYHNEKLNKDDFKSDGYYREIISKYSPGELSYLDNFDLDEKDIVATLMALELKKKIKIGKSIEIIDNSDYHLRESEKYILKSIKNNSLKDIDMIAFKKCIINNCIQDNLLEERQDVRTKIIKKIFICIFAFIVSIVCFLCGPHLLNTIAKDNSIMLILGMIIMVIVFFVMVIFPFTTFTYIMSYFKLNKLDPYIRSKKGKEMNLKLEGLRNYIKDFSSLDKKNYEELIIWEDYLIYSVILGQNTKVVKEIMGLKVLNHEYRNNSKK